MQVRQAAPLDARVRLIATSALGRRALLIIGVITCAFGLVLALWPGLLGFFPNLPAAVASDATAMTAWTGVAFQRLAGVLVAALGGVAVAISRLDDQRSSRLAAAVLAGASGVGAGIAAIQQLAIWSVNTWHGWLIVAALAALAVAAAVVAITEQRAIAQRDHEAEQRQAAMDAQLRETAAQEERNRLARDLHDTIKQQLFSINVAAATAQSLRERDPAEAAQQIQQVRDLSQAASVEMKALLTQLRPQPLATVGLIGAIQEQLDALKFRSEVQTELRCDDLPDESQLPLGAQEAIFRVIQEALANVARHARAKRVMVTLNIPHSLPLSVGEGINPPSPYGRGASGPLRGHGGEGRLRVTIQDDGQGFDPANSKAGMGTSNMRARIAELGGALDVQSAPHLGTTVTFDVPLTSTEQAHERAQQQKEERYQQVYWASSLSAFTGTMVIVLLFVLAQLLQQITGGNVTWAPVVLLLTLGTAVTLPLFFASVNFRRRVRVLAAEGDIWAKLLRSYDLGQVAWFALLCTLVLLSLKQFLWGGVIGIATLVAMLAAWRADRAIHGRTGEWATYRMLRTRRNEQMVFLGIAVVLIVLIFSGLYGDVREVRFFHDEINGEWFASFMTLIYPLLILGTAPWLITLQRQMNSLRAQGDNDWKRASPASAGASALRPLRFAATALAFAYGAMVLPLAGIGLLVGPAGLSVIALAVAPILLIVKWLIERRLTTQVEAWSDLGHQNSVMTLYSIFLVAMLFGVGGAIIGYFAAASTPDGASTLPQSRLSPAMIAALGGWFAGLPFYLALMTAQTWRRIQTLKRVAQAQTQA
jgi:signal transduction histidine kinase